jgi:hypothetical protein
VLNVEGMDISDGTVGEGERGALGVALERGGTQTRKGRRNEPRRLTRAAAAGHSDCVNGFREIDG